MEQPTQSNLQREQELAEGQAIINTLKTNHDRAYEEREERWEQDHPGKKFYERSEGDNRRDCSLDEWFWDFFERAHGSESAEARYQH